MDCIDHGRTRSLRPEGYARVGIPGVASRSTCLHRLVYAKKMGKTLDEIKGVIVRHTCDNPRCINPDHLIGGTRADNNRDRAIRGRSAKVVPSRQALTKHNVKFIQEHYQAEPRGNPYSAVNLARMFHVDSKVIYKVIRGEYNACLG